MTNNPPPKFEETNTYSDVVLCFCSEGWGRWCGCHSLLEDSHHHICESEVHMMRMMMTMLTISHPSTILANAKTQTLFQFRTLISIYNIHFTGYNCPRKEEQKECRQRHDSKVCHMVEIFIPTFQFVMGLSGRQKPRPHKSQGRIDSCIATDCIHACMHGDLLSLVMLLLVIEPDRARAIQQECISSFTHITGRGSHHHRL
jgi:hypothetical protein